MRTLNLVLVFLILGSFAIGKKKPAPVEKPLYCQVAVIDQFNRAWAATLNGTADDGTREVGFRIDRVLGKIQVGELIAGDAPLHIWIPTTMATVAIAHVHPQGGEWKPSDIDMDDGFTNYVLSSQGMNVTEPGKHKFHLLRKRLEWSKVEGCQ